MTTTGGRYSQGRRHRTTFLAVAMTVAVALALGGAVRLGAEPAGAPRFEWAFDGAVNATARSGNTVFVGGAFRNVLPVSGVLGQIYAVSPATGAVVPSTLPRLTTSDGNVNPSVISDGAGGFFLRGNLTIGAGTAPNRVVHLRADGSVDPNFQSPPELSGSGVMVRVGPSLILAGFNTVSGVIRPLVALDAVTGALSSWHPDTKDDDVARAAVAANGVLYVASGYFYGGTRRIMAFDGTSGIKLWEDDLGPGSGLLGGGLVLAGGRLIAVAGGLRAYAPATGVRDLAWGAVSPGGSGAIFNIASDGTTVYLAGSFTALDGQPRSRLGAVSVATGALLPWAPQASTNVELSVTPAGAVFVSGYGLGAGQGGTINGLTRTGGVFEIDTAGAVTPFELQVVTDNAAVATVSGGTLVISSSPAVTAVTARHGVAAFDATTGALLPLTVTLQGQAGGFPPEVRQLVADGQALHLFGTFSGINGASRNGGASIDASSGALLPAWALTGLRMSGLGPVINGWLYLTAAPDLPNTFEPELRRMNPATGVFDPGWRPTLPNILQVFQARGELLVQSALTTPGQGTIGTILSTVDQGAGAVHEEFRTTLSESGWMAVDGGTAYVLSRDLTSNYGPFDYGSTIFAFDRATGVPVARPPVSGRIRAFALADGRVVLGGRNLTLAGIERFGLMELSRTGTPTTWDGGYPPLGPYAARGGAPGGVVRVDVHGDLLVTVGAMTGATRLAVFPLSGSTAPSGLRTRALGDQVEFTWDSAAHPPVGGYVLEGGFSPGQTAVSLPVGATTTFTASAAVLGPAFVRVRSLADPDVSNEVVFGCFAPPLPPTALTTTLNGTTLTLSWTAPAGAVTNYTLLAGSASGLTDVATLPVGALTSASGQVPGGTFFARVTASNPCGTSAPSGEVFFTIGAPDALPAAPTNLTSTVAGSTLTLSWTAPAGPVTGYVLAAGSAPGLANIGAATIGAGTSFVIPGVPTGVYYVRARAITSAGSGAASSDAAVIVP